MKATRPKTPAEKAAETRRKNKEREQRLAKDRAEAEHWANTWPKVFEMCGSTDTPARTIQRMFSDKGPTVMNGEVRLERYRITIERVEEPVQILRDRLKKLWRESEHNHHNWDPMRVAAVKLGMDPAELEYEDQGVDYRKGEQ